LLAQANNVSNRELNPIVWEHNPIVTDSANLKPLGNKKQETGAVSSPAPAGFLFVVQGPWFLTQPTCTEASMAVDSCLWDEVAAVRLLGGN
jgi:hypothetical protein